MGKADEMREATEKALKLQRDIEVAREEARDKARKKASIDGRDAAILALDEQLQKISVAAGQGKRTIQLCLGDYPTGDDGSSSYYVSALTDTTVHLLKTEGFEVESKVEFSKGTYGDGYSTSDSYYSTVTVKW